MHAKVKGEAGVGHKILHRLYHRFEVMVTEFIYTGLG